MRWKRGHRSDHVENRRGQSGAGIGGAGGAIAPLFRLAASFGWKGILVFLVGLVAFYFLAGSPSQVANVDGGAPAQGDPAVEFVSFVLDDVQATWTRQLGAAYRPTDLVLYTGSTGTACGYGAAATGPFYCPADQRVYIDLSFYEDLSRRFGAPGDFAQAYVIAHEVGHHVQHLTGLDEQARGSGAAGGSVRLELQADCFAGVWAQSTSQRQLLEQGDLEEALTAASAIGDDRLQRQSEGTVSPDSFTHGTSEQRMRWFRRGYETGSAKACDTFASKVL